ncbi:MAG: hypothetical protein R6U13_05930 [Desulfatiglandaceae bacterium]
MENNHGDLKKNIRKKGIALVVVLGFLAVLTLMAVGMAISMRTERLASRSYLDMVKARLYCESALADSMSFLEEAAYGVGLNAGEEWNPKNKVMPNFRDYFLKSGSGERPIIYFRQWNAFPEHYILPSIKTEVGDPDADVFTNSLINGTGTNYIKYIPGRLWRGFVESSGGIGSERLQGKAQWMHVKDDDKVVGRFMYVVINTTGRADVNYVERKIQPSGMRINGRPLKSIPPDDAGYQTFLDDRREDIRYETFRDMRDANITLSPHEQGGGLWNIEGEAPVDITSFTYFRPMRKITATDGEDITVEFVPVYLDPQQDSLSASKSDVEEAFERVIDGGERVQNDGADWKDAPGACDKTDLYNLLEDYIDDDHEPHDPEGPSCEAVPMVNEVYVTKNNIAVEVWEPFVGSNRFENTFEVEIELNGAKQPKNGPSSRNVPDPFKPFDPETVSFAQTTPLTKAVDNLVVTVLDDGTVLDRVDFGKFSNSIDLDTSWECNDPRFNHDESQWKEADSPSLGDINEVALQGMADNAASVGNDDYVRDGDYLMYCANSPLVCSGELGYLPVAPWRTLKLYNDPRDTRSDVENMDPVLDYFTVLPNKEPMYGLINPNEKFDNHYDILKALLGTGNECWQLFPGDDSSNSSALNDNIFRNIKIVTNPFINISDVGRHIYTNKVSKSELRTEGPMRRHSALASVRGQVYTVLLWGQALGEGEGEDWDSYPILAEAQAVAMVWRDPYPNENGQHEKFVRFMRWFE